MIYTVCFCLALAALAVGLYETISLRKSTRLTSSKPIRRAAAGVFAASFFLFIPIYDGIFRGDELSAVKTFLLAIHNSIRLFIVDGEFDIIKDNVAPAGALAPVYSLLAAILFVAAPALTFGLILTALKNLFGKVLIRFFSRGKDIYVLSELNERSVTLAESIRRENPKCRIIFTDVYADDSEEYSELALRARAVNAVTLRNDIETVELPDNHRKTSMFIMGGEESEKLRQAVNLIDKYRDRDNTDLFVFSSEIEAEMLLADIDRGKIRLRRINESHALVNRFLHEEGAMLFDHAADNGRGDREIRAVIVGLDKYGEEMFRALPWFCQMTGYKLYMDVYTSEENDGDRLRDSYPELLDEEHNGKIVPGGDAFYDIRIHEGVQVASGSFSRGLAEFAPTFIFVSLDDGSNNVDAAVRARMICLRAGSRPDIVTVCTDSKINEGLEGSSNFKGQKYDIHFIGSVSELYSGHSVLGSEIEQEALENHMAWGSEESFWNYEYNYKSSIASAIHNKMKRHCGIRGALKTADEMSQEEKDELALLEHSRWNAYMRSEGYIYRPERYDLAKTHHCLIPFEQLPDDQKIKDVNAAALKK